MIPPLFGLVLSGGYSTRMGQDKGSLVYDSFSREDMRTRGFHLLKRVCDDVFISCRVEQSQCINSRKLRRYDCIEGGGPGVGILSAHALNREAAWLVLACDMPFVNEDAVFDLAKRRNPEKAATGFVIQGEQVIEPLFAIWEPLGLTALEKAFQEGEMSLRRVLRQLECYVRVLEEERVLTNMNTWEEYESLICQGAGLSK